ncbi:MAG: hypothetical protein ACK5V2_10320 [Pseudomonadota bacterium]|nr:hypothetical protein [Rubrivivax sp.]MCA3259050.1 hypothetical protein [Rubrivivax sp.]MCE2912648.1 hypothetical protein [Rubrivivax sp.]MCZ8032736.1 hypothetical protein [Rubrivivax sp.]
MNHAAFRRGRTAASVLAVLAVLGAVSSGSALAQQAPQPAWAWKSGDLALDAGLETYTAFYSMSGTWWNLAATSAPTFDKSRSFTELWVHPRLNGRFRLDGTTEAYGTLSVGATKTIGADAFDYRDESAVRFGSAMLGVRGQAGGVRYDVSAGRQPFMLGTGMLLVMGSGNGYSWGGGASTQRKAWGRTALARAGSGEFTASAFQLEPDEAPEGRTDTKVRGVALEWARPQMGRAGLSWFTVPRSNSIYPGDLAPLAFIEQGRQGLDTWYGWADITGLVPGVPTLGLRAEYAQQRNDITRTGGRRDPMKASAWLLGASWWGQKLPFAPKFSYHVARFSGDKPGTATYERFDPMFWGNGLDNWWFGANGAYSWLNANLRAQRFIVDAYFSQQDIIQFQYVRASVDQLNSAVQFGQGVRFTANGLLVGVPQAKLSDELYLQYVRVFNPNLVAIAFVARSSPGAGLKATAPQGTQAWTTFGLGLTANF